jgi:hypothetical protein
MVARLLRPSDGRMVNLMLRPGHGEDRAPVLTLREGVEGGLTLGALGDRGKQRAEEGAEAADRLARTRADAPEKKGLLAPGRPAIETAWSQLWCRFLDRVFSRSWRGLWNPLPLKLSYYNLPHAGVLSA